jgi:hypothetical protein
VDIIKKNTGMRFCFYLGVCSITAIAADMRYVGTEQPRVRSVVRAHLKTGRLVRAVVVSPKLVVPKTVEQNEPRTHVPEIIESTARKYDVDPLLVHSLIQVESGYNPYAVSSKGALGLMQLMPGTARRFGVKDVFDVRDNIEGGIRYLKYLDSLFPNDLRLRLAAYNAGEGAVWKYNNRIPPYRETEQYVYRVGARYGKAVREAQKKKSNPAPAGQSVTAVPEPSFAHVESFVDSEGRLHLRTAPNAKDASEPIRTP